MNKSKHYMTTLVGAIVLVWAFTASSRAQKYSEWSGPINLGPTVNSTSMDRGPAISKDGLSLYFASTRPDDGFGGEDIYVSQRDTRDDEWGPAVNLGPTINTADNEMVPAFSRDGHLLFFASNRPGFGMVDIWVSRRDRTHDDFAWQPAENLGAGVNSAAQDEGPSYFENDDAGVPQLYFSSGASRPGGAGIYVSEQAADGSFGPAVRVVELGAAGTSRPSIRHDGLEIFFNSNRPGSIANSQDLWVATRDTVFDAWSEPINLGSPINTELVDVQPFISSDRQTLFFASNRRGGGPTDLYMSMRRKGSRK
jgi:hypothetical protein